MRQPAIPGRHIEIFLAEADRVLDIEMDDADPALAHVVVEAIERDDPDDAEQVLRVGVGAQGTVSRRP